MLLFFLRAELDLQPFKGISSYNIFFSEFHLHHIEFVYAAVPCSRRRSHRSIGLHFSNLTTRNTSHCNWDIFQWGSKLRVLQMASPLHSVAFKLCAEKKSIIKEFFPTSLRQEKRTTREVGHSSCVACTSNIRIVLRDLALDSTRSFIFICHVGLRKITEKLDLCDFALEMAARLLHI